ncbi:MAG TPA: ATP-dependent Clp protease proteolytic subunit [Selenomonadales bacterium]|nr:ATP-dependent Clp protease proteolytic subunit [Selenomonadales bacterium]
MEGAHIDFTQILWLFFLVFTIWPMFKHQRMERARIGLIRSIEERHKSRLITMIHRQEAISILGMPISRYINIEDSEQVLRAIRLTPDDMPIDLVLHTPGGLVLASEQIAHALMRHPAKVTVFVPHYAMSGGTMIALAADEIVMDCNSVLGPVDPQLGQYPAASILNAVKRKNVNRVEDNTLIMADMAEKAMRQVEEFLTRLLSDKLPPEQAQALAKTLSEGRWTHDYPITCDRLKDMGLPINPELPTEIYDLMELYPQPAQRRPSVQYIPVPYGRETTKRE